MEIIPAVDVLDGKVVRLLQGKYSEVTTYGQDPVSVARSWIEQGATLVHVVDLGAARSGRPDPALWGSLAASGIPCQVGGGIREAATARAALEAGARRVVMGTAAVHQPQVLADVGDRSRLVAAIDVIGGAARGGGWEDAGRPWLEALAAVVEVGVERVLVTGVERDGTMEGPDFALLAAVNGAYRDLKVIASGGVGSLDDLEALAAAGYEAALVGRALYEGVFSLAKAISVAS